MAASTRSIHSRQRAAGGRSRSSTSRGSSPLPSAAARRGAHRPYSRNVGRPGKFARGAKHDEPVEQPAGGAVGHRRVAGRFGGRDAILGEQEVDDFLGRFRRGVWARRRSECSARRARSAARSRAEAAASAIAPAAAFGQAGSPGLGRRPAPGERRVGSRIFVAISGTGRGQRSRRAMTHVEHPEGEDFGFGGWGVRDGGERQGGGLGGRRNRIALPCASLQARCEAVRVRRARSSRAAASANPAGVEAGRPAGEIAPERRAGSPRARAASPTAKRRSRSAASSALRRRILAEAAAL